MNLTSWVSALGTLVGRLSPVAHQLNGAAKIYLEKGQDPEPVTVPGKLQVHTI
ncbi:MULTISPECIES: hypothetical protein [Glutamicibacter]|uniref:Uncharacterized protein n=1 Tax=Glutamicibacter ectropisis TaxID=3046593 RepID=A0AAU6WFQ5_9MICC